MFYSWKMYDDSGKAVNGGCRSQGLTCDYIHPNERGWTRAPFRNHHLPTPLGIPDSVRGQAPQQNPNTSKAVSISIKSYFRVVHLGGPCLY